MCGLLSVPLQSHHESLSHLRPAIVSDDDLDPNGIEADPAMGPWHGDYTPYTPGLNSLSDLFLIWHEAQSTPHPDPGIALQTYQIKVQNVIDSLPPELRWRGGLSRPANVTHGHDAQIANIFITSLHVQSNLLQRLGPPECLAEHQRVVDDLIEVLYHLPRDVFDSNGSSIVPKIRDIGAAYLEQNAIAEERGLDNASSARGKMERLLRKLDDLDCWTVLEAIDSPSLGHASV